MNSFIRKRDENSGVIFDEFADESNRELVVRQNFRKKILVATESRYPDYAKNT